VAAVDNNLSARLALFSNQPAARQVALLVGLAMSIALGVGLVQWAATPDYKPLFGSLSGSDANQAIATLEANGFDYRLDNRTGMLAVSSDQVQRARLMLASEGLPNGTGRGFDSLYQEQEIGVSSFMERARFHRSLEQELSQTIAALDGVRGARVHLAIARQSAFLRKQDTPAASVVLHLYAGQKLSNQQLAGVVNLVSSSVPSLTPDAVAVVDQQGKLLSGQGQSDDFGYTSEQFRLAELLELRYSERIVSILEPILGSGAVRAEVSADIDFTRVERTSEEYNSPQQMVRSEQTSEEISSRRGASGVPGTLSTQPPAETVVTDQPPEDAGAEETVPMNTNRSSLRNYEIDKTISHIRETPGSIRKLSVALVVDYAQQTAEDGSATRVALEPERIEEITQLARDAIGFDAARGDSVSVINASFVELSNIDEPLAEPSWLEQDWVWNLGRWLAVAIGVVSVVLFVLRPLIAYATQPSNQAYPSLPGSAPGGSGESGVALEDGRQGGLAEDRVTLGAGQAALPPHNYQLQMEKARSVVDEEPRRAAQVMKQWVADGG